MTFANLVAWLEDRVAAETAARRIALVAEIAYRRPDIARRAAQETIWAVTYATHADLEGALLWKAAEAARLVTVFHGPEYRLKDLN